MHVQICEQKNVHVQIYEQICVWGRMNEMKNTFRDPFYPVGSGFYCYSCTGPDSTQFTTHPVLGGGVFSPLLPSPARENLS